MENNSINNPQSFKNYQKELMDDYSLFLDFFKKSKIKWWAHSGTLLGFVRDGEIISWDDDIDMGMRLIDYVNNRKEIVKFSNSIGYDVLDPLFNAGLDTVKLIKRNKSYILFEDDVCYSSPHLDLMLAFKKKRNTKGKIRSISMKINNIYGKINFLPPYGWINGKLMKIPIWFNWVVLPFKPFLIFTKLIVKRNFKKKVNDDSRSELTFYYNYPDRNYQYDIDNLIELKIHNLKVPVSKNYKSELEFFFGDWNKYPKREKMVPRHLLLSKVENDR